MKNRQDPRHKKRQSVIKDLFAWGFDSHQPIVNKYTQQIIDHLPTIDRTIVTAAPQWPIDKINRLDLAILRLAVYEMIIDCRQPKKVIIDEAIELAKQYGSDKSANFINGALGAILTNHESN